MSQCSLGVALCALPWPRVGIVWGHLVGKMGWRRAGQLQRNPFWHLIFRAVLWDRDFFLLRTAPRDHQPPTTNRHQPPTATNRQPLTAANRQQRPTANRQPPNHCQPPPITNHQPPPTTTNRQLPTANRQHQPPTANRQPPPTMVEHMSYMRSFWTTWVQEQFFFSSLRTALLIFLPKASLPRPASFAFNSRTPPRTGGYGQPSAPARLLVDQRLRSCMEGCMEPNNNFPAKWAGEGSLAETARE